MSRSTCLWFILILLTLALPARAATLTVTNTADSGAGTLRNLVASTSPGDFIVFDPALSGQTITLTSGQLVVNNDLIVDASMLPGGVTINGHHKSRVFQFNAGTSVLIGLTFTNGYVSAQNGGALFVTNSTTLIVANCTFAGNSGAGYNCQGGAICNYGTLLVEQCTFSSNSISDNSEAAIGGNGGGIFNNGTLTVDQSTFFGNSANSGQGVGGGICNNGTLTVNQSTIFGNSANGSPGSSFIGVGGGIYSDGGLTVNQSTIFGNSANGSEGGFYGFGEGGGIFSYQNISIFNSIVASNFAPAYAPSGDIEMNYGELNFSGANIVQNIDANYIGPYPLNVAPGLAPLGNYGGLTQTMPLLIGSPAIDAGSNSATNQFATDQRGFPRLAGASVDIGAVEFQYGRIVSSAADSGENTLRADVEYEPSGSTITFAPNLSGQPIVLTSGQIVLSNNVTIDGRMPGGIQLSGNNASRVFNITSGTVSLFGLTLTGGNVDPGGAIYSAAGTHLTLLDCTLTGNSGFEGGAILNDGPLSLYQCTFANNSSGYGGAFQARAAASVVQCTFANNSATYGGGIYVKTSGLGIWNTIVDGNSADSGDDITIEGGYTLTYDGPNVISDVDIENGSTTLGPAPIPGPAHLTPLGNYGGPTQTMPPLPGSPVIDAGSDAITSDFSVDQRGLGFPRLVGAHVDIGAVEGVYVANYTGPGPLNNPTWAGNGSFQFGFTNYPDMNISFSVWASTNVASPFNQWSRIGAPVESPAGSGEFRFNDPQTANSPQRFYRVSSP